MPTALVKLGAWYSAIRPHHPEDLTRLLCLLRQVLNEIHSVVFVKEMTFVSGSYRLST